MSAQGGTLRTPVHVPMGLVIGTLVTLALAVSIALTVGRLTDRPAGDGVGVAQIDWGAQLAHPRVGDHSASASRMPEQRLYPDGFQQERRVVDTDGFHMPEQRLYPDGFQQEHGAYMGAEKMPEQRLYPDGF